MIYSYTPFEDTGKVFLKDTQNIALQIKLNDKMLGLL